MNLNDFTTALSESLIERGVSEDTVKNHIAKLIPTLSEEDLLEIASFSSPEDFRDISDCTAAMLSQTVTTGKLPPDTAARKAPERINSNYAADESAAPVTKENNDAPDYPETPEGKRRFMLTTAALSPLFAIAFVLYFALWGIAFAAEIGLIVFALASLIGCAAGGVGCAVGGVIYGVVTLGSVRSAGIYEIGFGIVILGVTLLASVLIYNFALRFMPFGIRKTAEFFRFCFRKVRALLNEYRRRCFTK